MTTNVEKLKAVLEKAAGDNEAGIGTAVGGAALAGGVAFGAHKGTQAYFRKQGLGEEYDKSRMGVIGGKAEAAAGKAIGKGKSLMGKLTAAFSKVAEEEEKKFKSTAAGALKGGLMGNLVGGGIGAGIVAAGGHASGKRGRDIAEHVISGRHGGKTMLALGAAGTILGAVHGHAKAERNNNEILSKSAALKDILAKLEQND